MSTYIVQSGDTLWDIAQKQLGSGNNWKQIQGYSGDPTRLPVGQKLTIPTGASMSIKPQYTPPAGLNYSPALKYSPVPKVSSATVLPRQQSIPYSPTSGQSWSSKQAQSFRKPYSSIPDWAWNQVVEGAKQSAKKYNIPASLTIAQFLQETGGNPDNFIGGTNVFGMKGTGTAGSMTLPTTEYMGGVPQRVQANFAKYNTIAEAVEEHAKNLTQNPAYSKLQGLIQKQNNNPFDYAQALQGIYATDPDYAKKLQNLIAGYGLAHADQYTDYPPPIPPFKKQIQDELDKKYPRI